MLLLHTCSYQYFAICLVLQTASAFVAHPHSLVPRVSVSSSHPEPLFSSEDRDDETPQMSASNVLGTPLQCCCSNVRGTGVGTGFYRNGYCSTGEQDIGRHTCCVQVTDEFLAFSKSVGNDLSTPMPEYLFPGLKDGDFWCLCAERWWQAFQAGKAPKVYLQRTHEKTLSYVPYEILRGFALDADEADAKMDDLNEQRSKLNKLLEE